MISAEKIQAHKEKLLALKEESRKVIKGFDTRPNFENEPGWEDEANESAASFDESAEENTYRDKMAEIDSALLRIEKGTYGVCESCGGDIEEDVLDLVPESDLCKECKKNENS